jgi:MFS family permease
MRALPTAPPVPGRAPDRAQSRGRQLAFVVVLCSAGIVVSLQQTLVIPIVGRLPAILGVSAADASWAVTATVLAGAIATPTIGRLADMFGKRPLLLICLVLMLAGSVVAAFAATLVPLVIGRALQGAAAAVVPLGISLMRDELPTERLGSATAQMSASLGVGSALGLPLSAVIADAVDWHALFWAGAALSAVVIALVLVVVPGSAQRAGGRFDLVGAIGLSIALTCALLAISKGGSWGWASPLTLGLLGFAVVVLAGWAWWELRIGHPLVDLRLIGRRQMLLTNAASGLFGFGLFTMSVLFPQLIQLPAATGFGLGGSLLVAGLALAPGGLFMMAMSPVAARVSAASGPRTTLLAGALLIGVGYGLGTAWHGQVWQLVVSSIVISCGVGLAYGALPVLVMDAVPVSRTASANSVNNLVRALGVSAASAGSGVLLTELAAPVGGVLLPTEAAFVTAMLVGVGAALLAVVAAVLLPRRAAR